MIDLDKLKSEFEKINNLDAAELVKLLSEHRNFLINFVLIIGSLWMAVGMLNDHRTQGQGLRVQMAQLQEKLEIIKARDVAVTDLNNFKSSLPPTLNEFELITLVSNYTKLHHVTVISLSPAESKDMGLYDVININFSAASDNFKDVILFLREIEKSKFPLRVDSWSGRETESGAITFEIAMSAVFIHQ